MKTRFTAADVAAQVACLRASCLGHRCANVYDLNPRTYLLKLSQSGADAAAAAAAGAGAGGAAGGAIGADGRAAQPAGAAADADADADGGARKTLLLLESGIRFHTTRFMRDKARAIRARRHAVARRRLTAARFPVCALAARRARRPATSRSSCACTCARGAW